MAIRPITPNELILLLHSSMLEYQRKRSKINCTGHRSLERLRKYEKISERQKEDACRALPGRSPMQCQTNSATYWSMQVAAPMYSSQHQQLTPNCSFGNATLNGCTINVLQAPQTVHNISKDEVGRGVVRNIGGGFPTMWARKRHKNFVAPTSGTTPTIFGY